MKKIAVLFLLFSSWTFGAHYYPNPDVGPYLEDVTEKFIQITSQANSPSWEVSPSLFEALAKDFSILKKSLPQTNPQFKVVYETCYLLSSQLAQWFSRIKFDYFNSKCFSPWKQITRELESKYSVKAKIKAFPKSGNAPLTVTFDARGSVDPSWDTIPKNNYFWYYKDSNWVEKFMWKWPVIRYAFDQPNDYVVHLTVRSVNKQTKWILDGHATITVSVSPPIANIVMYINWKKASGDWYVKLSSEEWQAWVLFDASWTTPNGYTKIIESTWVIKYGNNVVLKKTIPDFPWSVRVKLPQKWFYFVTLVIKDNTGKTVEKTFKVIVSNPVALIKVVPEVWNTSTNFVIDWSASYSVKWKIKDYKWTIIDAKGTTIDVMQWKKSFKYKFPSPGIYSIKLEIIDIEWNKNDAEYKLNVESTPPVANFIFKPYDNWEKPSTYVFDASYSYDVDEKVWDKIAYSWKFSNSKDIKVQYINNKKIAIAQFNKKWKYKIALTVTDKYGKSSSATKEVDILSTLRPKLSINPNYTVIWQPIKITVDTNKPTSYFEYIFGKKVIKTQSNTITYTYDTAWVFPITVKAYSIDGDENSITSTIFVWQRWYPLALYKVVKNKKIIQPTAYCKIKCKEKWCKFAPAYIVERNKDIIINAKDSINSQWYKKMLKIYFEKTDDNEYIVKDILDIKFIELGCQKITLYVRDLTNNKIDKKDIYFKVINASPEFKDLKMYFPQYGWNQTTAFKPNIGDSSLPKDIFAVGFDPLLIKLVAVGAYDPDSMLSYFRWYYYKKWDRSNLIDVKITPYNIPEAVFALPRIPWQYIFWVDVCDVDWKCTNSEKDLHLRPIVNIPPSLKNPDIPQVNSVRIDHGGIKWVWEVNVWDKLTIKVDTTILSKNIDFHASRTIKYDFDNDGKWDLTTKKDVVEHVYTKPGKYRVKVKVIYRWYGGIWFSAPLIVKKWLKPLVDINYKWKNLIFADLSMWDIEKKELCFDIKLCKKSKEFMFTKETYWNVFYPTTWLKLLHFKYTDRYWNSKSIKKKINIKNYTDSYLLTLPKYLENENGYKVVVAWMYKDWFLIYYHSKNKDCYIDKDITIDTDNDGNLSNDTDLLCNKLYKLNYVWNPQIILLINDGWEKKKIIIDFSLMEDTIPAKYKQYYNQLQQLIYKYSSSESEKVQYLIKLLSDLSKNLDDVTNKDAILLQLNDFISQDPWLIQSEDEKVIKSLISNLADVSTNAALSQDDSILSSVKQEILLLLSEDEEKIEELFSKLDQTSIKEERKSILKQIMNIALQQKKDWKIDDETLQIVKSDICALLKYYEIPSKACWTAIDEDVPVEEGGLSTIVKIILYILWGVVAIFIWLVIIFVIKAKKRRQEQQQQENNE